MEEKYSYYDYLRHELFEELIPRLLYKGTEKEQNDFFHLLLQENRHMVHGMFQTMCEDDGVPYPYNDMDFEAEIFERGGVNILQISLPPCNPETSAILRAYLLYTRRKDGSYIRKYFLIKRFDNGNVFNLYISPDLNGLLGEELTEHIGDMEYEYWKVVKNFAAIMIQDMRSGKGRNKSGKKVRNGYDRKNDKKEAREWSEDKINPDITVKDERLVELDRIVTEIKETIQ